MQQQRVGAVLHIVVVLRDHNVYLILMAHGHAIDMVLLCNTGHRLAHILPHLFAQQRAANNVAVLILADLRSVQEIRVQLLELAVELVIRLAGECSPRLEDDRRLNLLVNLFVRHRYANARRGLRNNLVLHDELQRLKDVAARVNRLSRVL